MFDVIVIGAGSAGCAMAGRLAEKDGLSVLLLEAGDTDRTLRSKIPALVASVVQNPQFDWRYLAEPDPSIGGRADIWPAGRRLGGGSAINGMMFVRGNPWDYDEWARRGARGWGYAEVLPFFRRLERNARGADGHRGGEGPLCVEESRARWPITDRWVEAVQQSGVARSTDLNGENAEGVDYVQVSQRNGLRHSSAAAYLRGGKAHPRLTVRLNAQATRILIENGRATAVEYRANGELRVERAAAGVVLCAGALNSPRLLMLSGVGPGAELARHGLPVMRDLAGVGHNLQDHVGTHLVDEVNVSTMNSEVQGLGALAHLARFVFTRRGAMTTAIGHAHAMVRSRPGLPAPNLQIIFAPFAFDLDHHGKLVLRTRPAVSQAVCVVRPKSRGTVELRSSDPFAAPVIRHQLLGDSDDLEQLAEGIELARGFVAQPALAGLVTEEVRPGPGLTGEALRNYCRLAAIPMYHPVGTCRMGTDADAVVDPDLKVRGVQGLWVADASVMPTLPAGNTNATAIMIGDKGAEHVLGALKAGAADAVSTP